MSPPPSPFPNPSLPPHLLLFVTFSSPPQIRHLLSTSSFPFSSCLHLHFHFTSSISSVSPPSDPPPFSSAPPPPPPCSFSSSSSSWKGYRERRSFTSSLVARRHARLASRTPREPRNLAESVSFQKGVGRKFALVGKFIISPLLPETTDLSLHLPRCRWRTTTFASSDRDSTYSHLARSRPCEYEWRMIRKSFFLYFPSSKRNDRVIESTIPI